MKIAGLNAILQEIAILTEICQHIVRLMAPVTISKIQHTVQQKQNSTDSYVCFFSTLLAFYTSIQHIFIHFGLTIIIKPAVHTQF